MLPTGRFSNGVWLTAMLALPMAPAQAQQGDLETMRADVRTPPPPAAPVSTPSHSPEPSYHGDGSLDPVGRDNREEGFFGLVFVGVLFGATTPFWVPPAMLGDHYGRPMYFCDYPYQRTGGYLVDTIEPIDLRRLTTELLNEDEDDYDEEDGFPKERRPHSRAWPWALRLGAEYGDAFNRTSRTGGSVLLSTASRFGLDAEWHSLRETRPNGGHDHLGLGDCNVVFRFAQHEKIEFRSGLGFNWLADARDTDYGFNFNYAVDVYPRKPWVFSGSLDLGTLGHTHLVHVRTTVGLLWRRWEGYTGYDLYDVGNVHTSSLIAGVRLWL